MSIRVTKQSVLVFAEIPSELQVTMQSILAMGQSDPGDIRTAQQHIEVLGQSDPGDLIVSTQHLDVLGLPDPGYLRLSQQRIEVLGKPGSGRIRMTGLSMEVLHASWDLLNTVPHSHLSETLTQDINVAFGRITRDASNELILNDASRQTIFQLSASNSLVLGSLPEHNWLFEYAINNLDLTSVATTTRPWYINATDDLSSMTDASRHHLRFGDASDDLDLNDDLNVIRPWYRSEEHTITFSSILATDVLPVADTLTLNDVVSVVRPWSLSAQDDIVLNTDAVGDWYIAPVISQLNLSHDHDVTQPFNESMTHDLMYLVGRAKHTWHVVDALSEIQFVDGPYTPVPWHGDASDSLNLSQTARISWISLYAESVLDNWDYIVYLVYPKYPGTETGFLTLVQTAYVGRPFIGNCESTLSFSEQVDPSIRQVSASNILSLSHAEDVRYPRHVSAESEFLGPLVQVYDPLTTQYNLERLYELTHAAEYTISLGTLPIRTQNIWFTSEASAALALSTGTSASATNTIDLGDYAQLSIAESATSYLTLSHEARGLTTERASDTLSLLHEVDRIILRAPFEVTTNLLLTQTMAFVNLQDSTLHNYSPFVGSTTDPDAPSPPKTGQPVIGDSSGVTFFYPAVDPTLSIHLRGPEFDNKDSLAFHRIKRESRGGTLIVFADQIWPKIQHLTFQFNGLAEDEAQNFLDFCRQTLGKEVGLLDWENREWRGVIVSPQDPIVRDHRNGLTASVELEAELADIYSMTAYNMLSTMYDVVTFDAVFDRYATNNLFTVTQAAEFFTDRTRYLVSDLDTNDLATYLAVRDRSIAHSITITDAVMHDSDRPRSAASEIVANAIVEVLVYAQRPTDSEPDLDHQADGYMVRPRSVEHTLTLSELLDLNVILQKDIEQTLELISTPDHDAVRPRDASSTIDLSHLLHTNYILERGFVDNIILDHLVVQDSVFVRLPDVTLSLGDETERVALFLRPISTETTLDDLAERELVFVRQSDGDIGVEHLLHRNIVLNLAVHSDDLTWNKLDHLVEYVALFPRSLDHTLDLDHSNHATLFLGKDLSHTLVVSQEFTYTGDFNRSADNTLAATDEALYLAIFVRSLSNTLTLSEVITQLTVWDRYAENTLNLTSLGDRVAILNRAPTHTLTWDSTVEQDTIWPRSSADTMGLDHELDRIITVQKDESHTLTLSSIVTQDTVWPRTADSTLDLTGTVDRIATLGKELTHTVAIDSGAEQDTVWPRSATNTIGVGHGLEHIVELQKDQSHTLTIDSDAEQDTIWPRNTANTLDLTSIVDRIATLGKELTDTLTIDSDVEQDTIWPRSASSGVLIAQTPDVLIQVTKNQTDDLTLSDSVIRVILWDRYATSSLAWSISAEQDTIWPRSATSTLAATDIGDRTATLGKGLSQSLTWTSTAIMDTDWLRHITHDIDLTHVGDRVAILGRAFLDTISLSDTVSRVMLFDRYSTDTLSLTSTATETSILNRSATSVIELDSIATQDTVFEAFVVLDELNLSDDADRIATLQKQPSHTLTLSDSVEQDTIWPRSSTNTITLSDTGDRIATLGKSLSHTLDLSDSNEQDTIWPRSSSSTIDLDYVVDRTATLQKQPSHIIPLSDAGEQDTVWPRNSVDTLDLSGTGDRIATLGKSLNHTLDISDTNVQDTVRPLDSTSTIVLSHDYDRTTTLGKTLTSGLIFDTTPDQDMVWPRDAELLLTFDSVGDRTAVLGKQPSVTITLSQDFVYTGIFGRSADVSLDISDSGLYLAIFDRVLSNTIDATDSAGRVATYDRTESHTVTISHLLTRLIVVGKDLSHTLTPDHTAERQMVFDRYASNTLDPDDTASRSGILQLQAENTGTLSQSAEQDTIWPRNSSDTLTSTDQALYLAVFDRLLSNIMTVSATAEQDTVWPRSGSNSIDVSDTVDRIALVSHDGTSTLSPSDATTQNITRPLDASVTTSLDHDLDVIYSLQRESTNTLEPTGVIDYDAVRPRDSENTVGLNSILAFNGVYGRSFSSDFNLTDEFIGLMVWARSSSNAIDPDHTALYLAIFDRSIDTTMSLDDTLAYTAVFPRSPDTSIDLTHVGDRTAILGKTLVSVLLAGQDIENPLIRPRDSENTVGLEHAIDVGYILQRSSDDTLDLDHTLVYPMVRPRSATSTPDLSQVVGRIIVVTKDLTSVLIVSQVLDDIWAYLRTATNTMDLDDTATRVFVVSRSATGTLDPSSSASYLAIFDHSLGNTLDVSGTVDTNFLRPRSADNTATLSDVASRVATLGKSFTQTINLSHTVLEETESLRHLVHSLDLSDSMDRVAILGKSLTDSLVPISDTAEELMVFQRDPTDTTDLTSAVTFLGVWDRYATTIWEPNQTASQNAVRPRSLESPLDTWHHLARIVSLGKLLTDDIPVDDTAEQDSVFPRSAGDSVAIDDQLDVNYVLDREMPHSLDLSQIFVGNMIRPRAATDSLDLDATLETIFLLGKDITDTLTLSDEVTEVSVLNRASTDDLDLISTPDRTIIVYKTMSHSMDLDDTATQDTFWALRALSHTIDLDHAADVLPVRFGNAINYLFPGQLAEALPITGGTTASELTDLDHEATADNTVKFHYGTDDIDLTDAATGLRIIERSITQDLTPSDTGDRTAVLGHTLSHTVTWDDDAFLSTIESPIDYLPLSDAAAVTRILDPNGRLYMIDQLYDEILSMKADGTDPYVVATTQIGAPYPDLNSGGGWHMVIDGINHKMYWTDNLRNKIMRADLDGSNVTEIRSWIPYLEPGWPGGILDVTVDPANNKIYYTHQNGGFGAVYQNNLDGTDESLIASTGGLGTYNLHSIAIDPADQQLYIGATTFVNPGVPGEIWRMNTDGSGLTLWMEIPGDPYYMEFVPAHESLLWVNQAGVSTFYQAHKDDTEETKIEVVYPNPHQIKDFAYNPNDDCIYSISSDTSSRYVEKIDWNGYNRTVVHTWPDATRPTNRTTVYGFAIDEAPIPTFLEDVEHTLNLSQVADRVAILERAETSTLVLESLEDYSFVVTADIEANLTFLDQIVYLVTEVSATSDMDLSHTAIEETDSYRLGTGTLSLSDDVNRIALVSHDAISNLTLSADAHEDFLSLEFVDSTIMWGYYANRETVYVRALSNLLIVEHDLKKVHIESAEDNLNLTQNINLGYLLTTPASSTINLSSDAVFDINRVLFATSDIGFTEDASRAGSTYTYDATDTLELDAPVYFPVDLAASNTLHLSGYSYYDIQVTIGPLWLGVSSGANGILGMNEYGQTKHIFGTSKHSDLRIDTVGNRVYGYGASDGPKVINSWDMDGNDPVGIVDLNDGTWSEWWAYHAGGYSTFDIIPSLGRLVFTVDGGHCPEGGCSAMYTVRMSDGGDHIQMLGAGGVFMYGSCLRRDPNTGLFWTFGSDTGSHTFHNLLVGNGYTNWSHVVAMPINKTYDAIAFDHNNDYVYFGASQDARIWRVNKTAPYNLQLVGTMTGQGGYEGVEKMVYDHESDILYLASKYAVYALDTNTMSLSTMRNTSAYDEGTYIYFDSVDLNDTTSFYHVRPRAAWNNMALDHSLSAVYSYHAPTPLTLSDELDLEQILNKDLDDTLVLEATAAQDTFWAIRTTADSIDLDHAASTIHVALRAAEDTLTLSYRTSRTFEVEHGDTLVLVQDLDRTAITNQSITDSITSTQSAVRYVVWPRSAISTLDLDHEAQETTIFSRSETDTLVALSDFAQKTFTPEATSTLVLDHTLVHGHANANTFALHLMDNQDNRCRVITLDGSHLKDLFESGVPFTPGDAVISLDDERIFWAETYSGAGALKSANLDGTGVEMLASGYANVMNVAVNDATDHVFAYVHSTNSTIRAIWRMNYDGSNPQKIVPGTSLTRVRGLEVSNGYLYIVDNGAGYIKRCELTGSNLTNLVQTNTDPTGPTAITIDPVNEKMFWSDMMHQDIKSADLDGSNVAQVAFIATYAVDMVYNFEDEYIYYTHQGDSHQVRRIKAYASFPTQEIIRIDNDASYTGIALGPQDWIIHLSAADSFTPEHSASVDVVWARTVEHTIPVTDEMDRIAILGRTLASGLDIDDTILGYLGSYEPVEQAIPLDDQLDLVAIPLRLGENDLDLDSDANTLWSAGRTVTQGLTLSDVVLYDLDEHVEGDGRVYTGEGYEGDSLHSRIVKFRPDLTGKETAIELNDLPYPAGSQAYPNDTWDLGIVDDRIYFGSYVFGYEFGCDLNGANFYVYPNPPVYRASRSFVDSQNNNMYAIHAPAILFNNGYGSIWDLDNVNPDVNFGSGYASDLAGDGANRRLWYADRSPTGRIVEKNLDTNAEIVRLGNLTDFPGTRPWIHLNYDETNGRLFWLYKSLSTGYARAFYADVDGPSAWVITEISIPSGHFEHIAFNAVNDSIYTVCYQDNAAAGTYIGLHSVKITAPHTHNQVSAGTEYQRPWGLAIAPYTGYTRTRQMLGDLDFVHSLVYGHVAPRSSSDTLDLSAIAGQDTVWPRSTAVSLSLGDESTVVFVPLKEVTANIDLSDSVTQNRIRTTDDTSTLTISSVVDEAFLSLEGSTSDIDLADTAVGAITVRQRWSESDLDLTDTGAETSILGRSATNAVTLSDVTTRIATLGKSLSNTLTASGLAVADMVYLRYASNAIDLSSIGDRNVVVTLAHDNTLTLVSIVDRNIVSQQAGSTTVELDSIGYETTDFNEVIIHAATISDELATLFVLGPPLADDLDLSDSSGETLVLPRFGEDSTDLAQALNLGYTLTRDLDTDLTVGDVATSITFRDRDASSTFTLTSISDKQPIFSRFAAHTMTLDDDLDLTSILNKSIESTLTLDEVLSYEHFISPASSSSIDLDDIIVVEVIRNAANTLILSDASVFDVVWDRYAENTLVMDDSANEAVVSPRSVDHEIAASDVATQDTVWARDLTNAIELTDDLNLGYSLQRSGTSDLTLSSAASFNITRNRTGDNTITLSSLPGETTVALQALESTAALGQALSLASSVYNRDSDDTLTWQSRAWDSIVEDTEVSFTLDDNMAVSIVYAGDDFTTHPRVTENVVDLTQESTFNLASVESADNTGDLTQTATRSMTFARSASDDLTWAHRVWPRTYDGDAEDTLVPASSASAVIEPPESGSLYVIDKE